jgi:hypothetical protein
MMDSISLQNVAKCSKITLLSELRRTYGSEIWATVVASNICKQTPLFRRRDDVKSKESRMAVDRVESYFKRRSPMSQSVRLLFKKKYCLSSEVLPDGS